MHPAHHSASPRKPWWRLAGVLALIAGLVTAIGYTPADEFWLLTPLMLALIYAAVPLLLLSLRDALAHSWAAWQRRRGQPANPSRGWLLLHICALFALVLGILLAWLLPMDPPAPSSWWLVLFLPALVYATPLLLALHAGGGWVLGWLWRQLRR